MLTELLNNRAIVVPVVAWALAQLMKVIVVLIQKKQLDFRYFVVSGGMPSSHSSFVAALATTVALVEGIGSTAFGIAAVFALVVMYDAAGIRQSVGQQAAVLNRIMREIGQRQPAKVLGREFRELVGHTPYQVMMGGLLGVVVAWLWYLIV